MAEKLCPVTGEPCVAFCSESNCAAERLLPLVVDAGERAIDNKARDLANLDRLPLQNRRSLEVILATQARKTL